MNIPRTHLLFAAAFLLSLGVLAGAHAQVNVNDRSNMPGSGQDGNNNSNPRSMEDSSFFRQTVDNASAEIAYSNLASTKAADPDVKKLAGKIVADETAFLGKMKPALDELAVAMPKKMPKASQAELNKLNGLSGPEFDKEYLAILKIDRQKDAKDFHTEAQLGGLPAYRDIASTGEAMLREQSGLIEKLTDKSVSGTQQN